MPLWIPAITLLLAVASDRSEAKRRCRLVPPDMRWLTVQESATDMLINGLDYDLVDWLLELAQRAGAPPLLDQRARQRMQQDLRHVLGAVVVVDPHTGFWSVRHGPWLVQTEPWCMDCLEGLPKVPPTTGQQLVLYRRESERRRQRGEMVPPGAQHLFAELWLPAAPLQPNPLGLRYNVVQVSVWRVGREPRPIYRVGPKNAWLGPGSYWAEDPETARRFGRGNQRYQTEVESTDRVLDLATIDDIVNVLVQLGISPERAEDLFMMNDWSEDPEVIRLLSQHYDWVRQPLEPLGTTHKEWVMITDQAEP